MGYARATRKSGETAGTWAEAFRNVFAFLFRRRSSVSNVRTPVQTMVANNPYTMGDGEVAVSFRVGCRYFDRTKNRVFECIALKGKRARYVAFGCLDSIERDKSLLKDFGEFKKTRIDGGAETCERGALRADRQATESEVAGELDFLRKLRQREKDYKPGVSFKVEISGG